VLNAQSCQRYSSHVEIRKTKDKNTKKGKKELNNVALNILVNVQVNNKNLCLNCVCLFIYLTTSEFK